MDHSHHMDSLAVMIGTPTHISILSAAIFVGMFLFYVVRAFFPSTVRACCGYYSPLQEMAHGLCAVGMIAMSVPRYFLAISPLVWVAVFSLIALVYLGIFTFRKSESKPGAVWCIVHVGIFSGMAYMFFGAPWPTLSVVFIIGYVYAAFFFQRELRESLQTRPLPPLAIGAEVFHILMSITMILMYLFPKVFMPEMPMCSPLDT